MRKRVVVVAAVFSVACERPTEPLAETITLESAWTAPSTVYTPYDTVETQPRVRALDEAGRPVAGVRVTFAALRQPDAHFVREVLTDASGYAELDELWTVGRTAGTQTILAYLVSGQTGDPIEYQVTVGPGAATRIFVTRTQTLNIPVGDTVQFSAAYLDLYGNSVPVGPPIAFEAGTPSVLTVNATGSAIGVASGQAWVVGVGAGIRDSIRVTVGPGFLTLRTFGIPGISGAVTPQGVIFASNWGSNDFRYAFLTGQLAVLPTSSGYSDLSYAPVEDVVWRVGEGITGLRALNPSTGALIRNVGSGGPYLRLAVSPDGSEAFVTQLNGGVRRINTVTGAIVSSIDIGDALNGIALDTAQSVVYVSRSNGGRVFKLSMLDLSIIDSSATIGGSQAVALSPDGSRLFVAGDDGVQVLDPQTLASLGSLPGVTLGYDVAISQRGKAIIVTRIGLGRVWVFDLSTLALRFEVSAFEPRRILIEPITQDAFILSEAGYLYRLMPR